MFWRINVRISKTNIEKILRLPDAEAGSLFKRYLRVKNGEQVQITSELDKTLLKSLKKSISKLEFSEDVFSTYERAIRYFDDYLVPSDEKTKHKWLDTIDKLIRIDKLDPLVILAIIKNARADDFWRKNFMAIPKLRRTNPDGIKYIQVFYEQFKPKKKQQVSNDYKQAILRDLQSE